VNIYKIRLTAPDNRQWRTVNRCMNRCALYFKIAQNTEPTTAWYSPDFASYQEER